MPVFFKPGDKVRFLNDTGSGSIIALLDQGKYLVLVDDFMEMEYEGRDLVPDQAFTPMPSPQTQNAIPLLPLHSYDAGVWLGYTLLPGTDAVSLFLWNNTPFSLTVLLYIHPGNVEGQKLFFPEILPQAQQKLHSILPPVTGNSPEWRFQILYQYAPDQMPVSPLDYSLKFKPKYFQSTRKLEDAFLIKRLESVSETESGKSKTALSTPAPIHLFIPDEIDLHAEKLEEIHAGMNAHEIFEIQFKKFHTCLENAIAMNKEKIIFVHGVGKGKLKEKIHKALSMHTEVDFYEEAQKEKYGYGATSVTLKKRRV